MDILTKILLIYTITFFAEEHENRLIAKHSIPIFCLNER